MTAFFVILTSLFFLFISLKLLFYTTRFKNLPPGPSFLPIIGNLHQLKKPFHHTFQTLSQKHGQIFSLWLGSRFVVVVSSLKTTQEFFTKHDIVLANRPHFLYGKYINYNYTTIIQASYGDHWRNLRRIITTELLSPNRLNSFLEIRRDEIMRLIQKLAKVSYHDFSEVELTPMLSELTFNTIMRMMSGKRYYGDDCDMSDVEEAKLFRDIIEEILSLAGANNISDFIGFLRWFDFDGLEKNLKRLSKRADSFLQKLIDEHKFGMRNANTMIDHLLKQQKLQPEYYTDQIIKGLIMVMLIAGTDTSATTLEWTMANLLNNPNILKKAKDELDTHMGQNQLIDEHDISKFSYLQNIIYETLRLHPPAPLLLPHLSSEDFTTEKYNIPQNTILLVNVWAIHRDPNLWTDPICFKPERFEKEGETNKLLSFGMGRRACPGTNLAHRTMSLTLGLLIQCFEWKRIGKEKIDMGEKKGSIMGKEIALKAMCKLRHPMKIKNAF